MIEGSSEFKRTLTRYLVESTDYCVLLQLRATCKEWLRICNQIMRQHYERNVLIGRGSMISVDTCMCCKRKRLYECFIYEILTPNQNIVTYCADNPQCKIRALFSANDEIKHLGGIIDCKNLANYIEMVQVLRSSGIVETDWKFVNFVWPAKGTVYARVTNQERNIEKGCRLKDFIQLNPNFLRSKGHITLRKTTFDDSKFLSQLQTSFEDAGIQISWVYRHFEDFIRIYHPPSSPA